MQQHCHIDDGEVGNVRGFHQLKQYKEWAWCVAFLPALVTYFILLTFRLNQLKVYAGLIEIIDPSFADVISGPIEIVSEGYEWAEGPVWIDDKSCSCSYLLISDTIMNKIWKWEEGNGLFTVGKSVYIDKSGCSNTSNCTTIYEPGSNGICQVPFRFGDLVVCQHGERRISYIFENGTSFPLALTYKGKMFNSPNDLAFSKDGHLYFTDPPYGLYSKNRTSLVGKELKFSGVYMIRKEQILEALQTGKTVENVTLVENKLTRPNGIGFFKDSSKLLISNSDRKNAVWQIYDVTQTGTLRNAQIFANMTSATTDTRTPDGFAIDSNDFVITAGPGGVIVFSPRGDIVAKILFSATASNVAISTTGYVYITAQHKVLRVKTKMRPQHSIAI